MKSGETRHDYDEMSLTLSLYCRRQLNVSVDLPTATSAADNPQLNLEAVLNNLQTTAFHLLGNHHIALAAAAADGCLSLLPSAGRETSSSYGYGVKA